jgi:hypothetical protein
MVGLIKNLRTSDLAPKEMRNNLRSSDLAPLLVLVGVLGFFGYVGWGHRLVPALKPADVDPGAIQQCYFHRITGVDCPLCGLTRSCEAVTRFQWRESCRLHPAGPVLCAAMLLVAGLALWSLGPGRDHGWTRWHRWGVILAAGAVGSSLILAWVARLTGLDPG